MSEQSDAHGPDEIASGETTPNQVAPNEVAPAQITRAPYWVWAVFAGGLVAALFSMATSVDVFQDAVGLARAERLMRAGRAADACAPLEDLHARRPGNVSISFSLARAQNMAGQFKAALATIDALSELNLNKDDQVSLAYLRHISERGESLAKGAK